MIFRHFLKNLSHRILHNGLAARHYVDVEADTGNDAVAQAKEHVTKNMRSFGKITQESVILMTPGEPAVIRTIKRRADKPKFSVVIDGDNTSTMNFNTELRAVKEAMKAAVKSGLPVITSQQMHTVVAEIKVVKKKKMPVWRVTFIEKED